MQSQYGGYKIDLIMIVSHCNIRLLDAAMRRPGPQLAGQRVATLSGHTGLLCPVRHRGRPVVVGELPSQQTWGRKNLIFSRYQYVIITLSFLLHPLLPGLGGF